MKNNIFIKLLLAFILWGVMTFATAQVNEFSISGSCNNSIIGGVAFDGVNYLVGLTGDATSDSNITVQFISQTGQLVGTRIQLGETGSPPIVAFDGTNYLLIWSDRYVAILDNGDDAGMTNMYGRFISPSGIFVGNKFTIATNAYIKGCISGNIHFNGSNYFFVYREDDGLGDVGPVYGQRISTTGSLLGSPVQISTNNVGDVALAFDGTNYLVVFAINSQFIYGQFISTSGSLVGTNFSIDNSVNASDNPVSVTFGGSQYLVAFHDQAAGGSGWNLFARFVSTSGNINANKIFISDSTQSPMIPLLAFDGTNYLTTWISFSTKQIKGQFYDTSGIPINSEFVVFDSISGLLPIGGVESFAGNNYLMGCTKINWNKSEKASTNAGIYGKFIQSSTGIIENKNFNKFFNLFPNPASEFITLNMDNVSNTDQIVNIYSVFGTLVKSEMLKQNQQKLNVNNLSNGIYMVEIKSIEWTKKQKLIIQR